MRLGGFDILIKKDTKAYNLFKDTNVRLRFRHRYEVDPKYVEVLEDYGMIFSGKSPTQPIMQILELAEHKFFMATQAHPEFSSRPLRPQPLFLEFVKTCLS